MARSSSRDDINQTISLTGDDEVKRQLEQIAATGSRSLTELSLASAAAGQDLGRLANVFANLSGLGAGAGAFSALSSAAGVFNTTIGATIGYCPNLGDYA